MAYSYRCVWENNYQWRARNTFLETYHDKFLPARLASLSMAWANWKFMGCQYPSEVQVLLEKLDKELPEEFDGSDCNKEVANQSKSSICVSDQVCISKEKMVSSDVYSISQFSGNKPRQVDVISKTERPLQFDFKLYTSEANEMSPIMLLCESAQKCKSELEFRDGIQPTGNQGLFFSCTVYLNGHFVVTSCGRNKKDAKREAAAKAVDILKARYPVIKKELEHRNCETIEKKDLVRSAFYSAPKIGSDNIGNKLLRQMGWDGHSALGKEGNKGIENPVFLTPTSGRIGLGSAHNFENSVHKSTAEEILMRFIRNEFETEIKFSSELSKADRAILHQLSQKYGLTHQSHGKDNCRYLVIGKKFST